VANEQEDDRRPEPASLMAMIAQSRVDLTPFVAHRLALDDIEQKFELFSDQRDRVMKVALRPRLRQAWPLSES
jgi:threonine dehydrogenase-like Zn-dependent dehydrogenase